jgi:heme-degrading monooxygenase HmoA
MAYSSINHVAIKPAAAAEFERIAEWRLRGERERLPREELLSRQLVRADGLAEYAVLSVWASREAHDRNEDSPAEQEALRLLAGLLVGQPTQFAGDVAIEGQ